MNEWCMPISYAHVLQSVRRKQQGWRRYWQGYKACSRVQLLLLTNFHMGLRLSWLQIWPAADPRPLTE